ncbi:MAG TPA: hypothetical protein VFL85_05115 [Candidatus Saccharimonadales bacterium]|nr:hypothetical protein [Candidatus Saccharimonadales bacterium]
MAVGKKPYLEAISRHQSQQELLIANTLQQTLLPQSNFKVECLDTFEDIRHGDTRQAWGPLPAVIPLQKAAICDPVTAYAGLANKSEITLKQASALNAIAHEADHIRFGSSDEAATECRAFQDMPAIARQLGASATQAKMTQQAQLFNYLGLAPHYQTTACREGGPYDKDPHHAGLFPYPHPAVIKFGDLSMRVGQAN